MSLWHAWVIAAVILFIAEIFTPTFLSACFGIGCLCAGAASFMGFGLKIQTVVFSVSSLIVFIGIRPFFLKYMLHAKKEVPTNTEALLNKAGIVTETINNDLRKGRVKIGGEDWKAVSADERVIEEGQKVIITNIEGVTLSVRKQ